MSQFHIITILLILANLAAASEIMEIIPSKRAAQVSHDSKQPWQQNQYACVKSEKHTSCGQIILVTELGAILQFFKSDVSTQTAKGQPVTRVDAKTKPNMQLETPDPDFESEMSPLYRAVMFGPKQELH